MKIDIEKKSFINNMFLSVVIYISAITLPLKNIFHSGVPVTVTILLMLVFSILLNRSVNLKLTLFIILIYMLMSADLYLISGYSGLPYVIEFSKKALIILYFASFVRLNEQFIENFKLISVIALCVYLLNFEQLLSKELSYMDFGNMTVMIVLSLALSMYANKRKTWTNYILLFFVLLLTLLFANRMAFICAISIVFVLRILCAKHKYQEIIKQATIFSILVAVLIALATNLNYFINFLQERGLYSYSLSKIQMALDQGVSASSSGRTELYNGTIQLIMEEPIAIKGMAYFSKKIDAPYPHNFILDFFVTFGVPLGIILTMIFLLFPCFVLLRKINVCNVILLVLWFISFVKLSLSSSYLIEPTLWLLVGLCFKNIKFNSVKGQKRLQSYAQ